MYKPKRFSCFLVGEGTLPIQCGEILLNQGHEIRGIISPDASINRWAEEKDIAHPEPADDLNAFLRRRPFDYLFSVVNIVNYRTLLKGSLEWPRKYAINYHDALLPTYAGFYPTSWALINRQNTHGVTWHQMTDLIDAGDILKQYRVKIADDDTAFTLNAKCYDAAIRSFAELIDDLSLDRVLGQKQQLKKRTFFPFDKRPPQGCVLRWDRRAHDIQAFVRALDFGPYPNPLGLPKFVVGKDFFIVSKIDVLDSKSRTPPGTITAIDDNSIKVSTVDSDVALHKVMTIDGEPISNSELVAQVNLREGDRFESLDEERSQRITAYYASMSNHEGFWIQRLRILRPGRLPYAGLTAPRRKTARYASVRIPLPREVVTFLEYHRPDWRTADFLLAAFGVYLSRISGARRFDIGFSDVELRRELRGLDGFFASHVPLRVNADNTRTFAEFFHALRGQSEPVRQHKTYARDLAARHHFFHWAPELEMKHGLPVIVRQAEKLDDYRAEPGSEFTLVTAGNSEECLWVYDAEVFDENNLNMMAGQFTTLIKGIAANPDRGTLAALPIMTDRERHHLLIELNDTKKDYPRDRCLHQLFEAQVDCTPEATALVVGHTQLTYRELNARANQLARYLADCGVGPEIPVGICMEHSVEMMVALLGIFKAGGAYAPLHPDYPRDRFSVILADTEVPILLTLQQLTSRLPEHGAKTICLDTDWKTIAQQDRANPSSKATPDNLAYVIYTSGSTGIPNGVMIEHRSLVSYLHWVNETLMTDGVDSVPLVSRLNFDASLKQLFAPLIRGGQVWALSDDVVMHPAALMQAFITKAAVALNCVPSLWAAILNAVESGQAATPDKPFASLFLGGEPLGKDLVQRSLVTLPHLQIWNLYGPTETTANSTAGRINSAGKITIGRPIANTQIHILDDYFNPVPIGIPGELYIGGAGLARGYFNRSNLTADKFMPNPFSREPGARLYKTGDRARYLPDGSIEFLGRIDDQVKIRGFRIEPKEIETILCQHPGVRENVVLAREQVEFSPFEIQSAQLLEKRLVAYVVPHFTPAPTASELRNFLKEKLPAYMIPAAFVMLESLPPAPNGKIDRRALPIPDQMRPELGEVFVPPRTPVEKTLAGVWAEVLKLEKVGIHDNFFELGGHSLLATQVISRARQTFHLDLPLRSLFESPTVAGLAETIDMLLWAGENYTASAKTGSGEREEIEV